MRRHGIVKSAEKGSRAHGSIDAVLESRQIDLFFEPITGGSGKNRSEIMLSPESPPGFAVYHNSAFTRKASFLQKVPKSRRGTGNLFPTIPSIIPAFVQTVSHPPSHFHRRNQLPNPIKSA